LGEAPAPSPIRRVFDRALELERAGRSIVHLEIGRPHLTSPDAAIRAATQALAAGNTHYTPNRGLLELREAIARNVQRTHGLAYDPESEVVVTAGGSEAVFAAVLSCLSPGDEAIVLDPAWPHYAAHIALARARAVHVACPAADGFQPDVDAVRAAIGPRTRMLVLSSPSNPTGAVIARERLLALAALAREHDLVVLADEIYERFVYDGEGHVSVATLDGMRERTLLANSLSKSYAMTGWRVGWLAGPPALLAPPATVHQYLTVCAASFAQVGAIAALEEGEPFVAAMTAAYRDRRDQLVRGLGDLPGVELAVAQGAFYAFPRVGGEDVALRLLEEAGVAVVPGEAFGAGFAGYLRISYAVDEATLSEGLSRLRALLGASG
jgi:aspartate/methionine/tyrosine aminotransferase